MTVTADIARWDYTGNGVLTTYPFTAEIYAATDLKVYVSDVLQVLNVNYTIAVGSIGVPAGGNVVFIAGSIPALDAPVSLILDLPLTQLVDYIEGDKFPAEVHERALDRLIKIAQMFMVGLKRVAKLPVSSLIDLVFPNPTANNYIGWNAAANNLENKPAPVVVPGTQYEVDALISYGGGTAYTKATIDATLTAVGTINPVTVLLRPGSWNIDANADYSAYKNVIFHIPNGALFNVDALMAITLYSPENIKATPNQQIFTGAGTVVFSVPGVMFPDWWDINAIPGTTDMYAALNAAESACATGGTIKLDGATYRVGTSLVMGSDINLDLSIPAAKFSIDTGKTITINGRFDAGLSQKFDCADITAIVVFGNSSILEVYPEWWGAVGDSDWPVDTGTNDYAALQAAITAHRKVRLTKKYRYTTALSIVNSGQEIYGISGMSNSLTPSGCAGFEITTNLTNLNFHDFALWGMNGAVFGFDMFGYVMRSVWERMMMGFFTSATLNFEGGLRNAIRDNYFSCGAPGSATEDNIHLHIVDNAIDGVATTFISEGNYYAYGSADVGRPIIYIRNIVTFTSINDIFENAEVAIDIDSATGFVMIGEHGELLGATPFKANDVRQGVAIANQNAVTATWTVAVPADERYFTQIGNLGYGEIFGVAGLSKSNTNASYTLRGQVTISDANVQETFNFEKAEPNTSYYAVASCSGITAAPAAGSTTLERLVKAVDQITVVIGTAPGAGNSVTFDVLVLR